MSRTFLSALLGGVLVGTALFGTRAVSANLETTIAVPDQAIRGQSTAVTLRLPANVAAVDARVLVQKDAAQLIGVAPLGGGHALTPIDISEGYAFAAYGLRPKAGRTTIRLVFVPLVSGRPELRVVVDAAADAAGRPLVIADTEAVARLQVGRGNILRPAPPGAGRPAAPRRASSTRDLFGRGTVSPDDLDIARAAWYQSRFDSTPCDLGDDAPDANGDGCIDIIDLQAVVADQGRQTTNRPFTARLEQGRIDTRFTASANEMPLPAVDALQAAVTFVVTSTADTPDATPGNGTCADSQGLCTLRAAMTEANWQPGEDRIHFDLAGTAPVRIQLTSGLPLVGSTSGGMIIDGYTQPGSQPNTATFGTNAIPGVEIRGTGISMSFAFYVPRAGNTLRGLLINNANSAIFVDTSAAANNRIVGNFVGFNADNSLPARGRAGVWLNNGATGTIVGTPLLADRNVIGNAEKAVYSYGAGTRGAVVQNNVLCMRPDGQGAICQIAFDHDFGPKASLIGGAGSNERNVVGPTGAGGIEFSHGWDPSTGQSTTTWQVNDHRIIGNWIGFRPDGSYDPTFRVAQQIPASDNGQGINIYDGSNNNLAEGNYIGSAHDGMTIAMSNSTGNTLRNNVVGESPLGESVHPMDGWGIYLYSNTRLHTIEGNVIRNATDGGIGLIDHNVQQIRISRNIISGTNGPGIFLAPNPNNPTSGANALLPSPVITAAGVSQANGTGIAGAMVELFRASRASGQAGLPVKFLGSALVAGNGTWNITFASVLQAGDRVTALQIRTNGDTSALSPNVYAGGLPPIPVADFDWSQTSGTLRVAFVDASSGSSTSWLWQFGDGLTSTEQNPTHIYGTGGDVTVTLTATNATGSGTSSQVVAVNSLPPGTTLAADTFTRTVGFGWDSAETGGPYSLEATVANYSVAGGAGVIVLPTTFANRAAVLDQVAGRDVNVTFRVRTDKPAAGNKFYIYSIVRRNGNNAYQPKIILYPNGSVAVHSGVLINNTESSIGTAIVVPGLSHTANNYIWVRAEVVGANPTTVRIKAWADGQPEPAGWQFTATNSASSVQSAGTVGLRAYVDAVSNAPVKFSFDDFLVKTPGVPPPPPAPTADFTFSQQAGTLAVNYTDTSTGAPTSWNWAFGDGSSSTQQNPNKAYAAAGEYTVTLTASNASGPDSISRTVIVVAPAVSTYAADGFGRTVGSGWGSAEIGGSYSLDGSASNFSVTGAQGNIVLPSGGANRGALLNGISARDVEVLFRVRSDKTALNGSQYVYGLVRRNGNNAYRPKIILNSNGSVAVHCGVLTNGSETSVAPAVTVAGLSHTANTFIWVRAQVTGASPTTIRVKAWADGQAEPIGWQFTATNSQSAVQTAGGIGLRVYMSGSTTNAPVTFGFDDFLVTSTP